MYFFVGLNESLSNCDMEVRNNGSPSDEQAGNEGHLVRVGPTLSVCVAALTLSLSLSPSGGEPERATEIFDVIAAPPPPYSLPSPAPDWLRRRHRRRRRNRKARRTREERDGGLYVAGDGRQYPGEVLGRSKSNRYLFEAQGRKYSKADRELRNFIGIAFVVLHRPPSICQFISATCHRLAVRLCRRRPRPPADRRCSG